MNNKRLKLTMSMLTPAERLLVLEMRRIWHGRIENLIVRKGQPVLPKQYVQVNRLGATDTTRPGDAFGDFELKGKICELICKIREMKDGVILVIKISHGVPTVYETPMSAGRHSIAS